MGEKCRDCEKMASVPFVVHEGEMTRLHSIIKRQWLAVVLSVMLAMVSVISLFGLEHARRGVAEQETDLSEVVEVINEDYQD